MGKALNALVFCSLFSLCPLFGENLPHWVWPSDHDRQGEGLVTLKKQFKVEGRIKTAHFRVTADFAALAIEVNGNWISSLEAYDPVREFDISRSLRKGMNEIEILATAVEGPTAIAAVISIEEQNGALVKIPTEPGWSECSSFGVIHPDRWASNSLPPVSQIAEYNQWKESQLGSSAKLSPLPPGFEIGLIRTARENEGSWVSMAFDGKGRMIVAKEQKGLLRLTLSKEGNEVQQVELIDDSLEECRGLLCIRGDLFANANDSKGLYRLRDTTGDDRFDEIELLRRTEGKTGHGRNDLSLGPEGRIHAIHGDVVLVPEDSERRTVLQVEAPLELGHQVSTDIDGNGWTIHNRGLRNPYGIDFNSDGEAFTYDADNEGDIGLPFYRPTRINHLVSGANYGWHQERGNTRNRMVYAPDSVPTTFDAGRGSPTAIKFGGRSSFPERYRKALFALDWAYGRILSIQLIPRGASYYGSGSIFLKGRPLNVTDLDFDERGDLYFITGGRKTQSALYRIQYTGRGQIGERSSSSVQETARNEFSRGARQRRRALERFHGVAGATADNLEEWFQSLGDPDPWIRNAARVALEWQPLELWHGKAFSCDSDLEGLTALMAITRRGGQPDAILKKVTKMSTEGWTRDERLTFLRICQLCGPNPSTDEKVESLIFPWLSEASVEVNKEVVRVLAMTHSSKAISSGLRLANEATDQLERLHYIEILSEATQGWNPDLRETYFRALDHARRFSYGDRFMGAFFNSIVEEALSNVEPEEDRLQFAALLEEEIQSPLPELKPRSFVKNWSVDELQDLLSMDLSSRNLENGGALYDAALCSRCHMVGSHGRPVGPDLTTVGRRFSRRDLLESIIDPSSVVAEAHRDSILRMKDGGVMVGRIVQNDYRKSVIYLSTNPFLSDELVEIAKGDIESYEQSTTSPMPPGLLNTLDRDEILDLLAWLESQGNSD